jgi:hypothetical protein
MICLYKICIHKLNYVEAVSTLFSYDLFQFFSHKHLCHLNRLIAGFFPTKFNIPTPCVLPKEGRIYHNLFGREKTRNVWK